MSKKHISYLPTDTKEGHKMTTKNGQSMNTLGNQLQDKITRKTGQARTQLETLLQESETRRSDRGHSRPARSPMYFADGEDHINIDCNGQTDLGKALAIDSMYSFTLPKYGDFSSILGLWAFLTTKGHPDFLRHAHPHILRAFIRNREETGQEFAHPHVNFICAYVLMDRIMMDNALRDSLTESGDAPLASYYVHAGYQRRHPHAYWWLDVVGYIRNDLVYGRKPSVSPFALDPDLTFDEACITLQRTKTLGTIKRPALAPAAMPDAQQSSTKKQKKPKEQKTPVDLHYVKEEDLKIDAIHTRILGVAKDAKYGEVFTHLQTFSEEELKNAIVSTQPDEVIPFSLTEEDLPEDQIEKTFVMFFDPVTYQLTGLASCLFDNPMSDIPEEPFELTITDEKVTKAGVSAAIHAALNISEDIFIRVFRVRQEEAEKPAAEPEIVADPVVTEVIDITPVDDQPQPEQASVTIATPISGESVTLVAPSNV